MDEFAHVEAADEGCEGGEADVRVFGGADCSYELEGE